MQPRREKVTFTGSQGGELAARLDLPQGTPRAFALFAHCFTCSKDIQAASRISGALARAGFAVLRFDFTGLGHSEGEFANTNFSSNVADLVLAAAHLRARYQAPQILIGHSLGGAAVIAAAPEIAEAKAVCTIGAPCDPGHVANLLADARAEIEAAGEAEVVIAGRSFRIRKQFLEDIAERRLDDTLGKLRKALLVFHAPRDKIVGIDNAAHIFLAARHPKSFISLDDADHLLSRTADADYVGNVIAAWAVRYLELSAEPLAAPRAAPGQVVVAESGAGRLAQAIDAGGHALWADEPAAVGGDDTGPSPYELLLAGLGACTAMTLRLYAERKQLALERVVVRLSHDKIHAEDCADCETKVGKIDRIEREIELSGNLDQEQRQRLLEIANKCPVHRTLESEVKVATSLAA